jgi:RimJ/RimL family protein N-acetyltransferase
MALASIEDARLNAGFTEIVAGVDEVNAASMRVLEKLGFKRDQTLPGAFGNMLTYKLSP